jgi:hypothetical protein
MANNIHVGDVGTVFKIKIIDDKTGNVLNLTGSSVKKIIFKKSDAAVVEHNAVFTTDGSDGLIQYKTVANDLDVDGLWYIQGRVVGGGYENRSEVKNFTVFANL